MTSDERKSLLPPSGDEELDECLSELTALVLGMVDDGMRLYKEQAGKDDDTDE